MKRMRSRQLLLFIFCYKCNKWGFGWEFHARKSKCGHSSWCKLCIEEDSKRQRREDSQRREDRKRDARIVKIEEQHMLQGGQRLFSARRSENPHLIFEDFIGKEIIVNGAYFRLTALGLASEHPDSVELSVRRIHL
jgi:hypothetical protein